MRALMSPRLWTFHAPISRFLGNREQRENTPPFRHVSDPQGGNLVRFQSDDVFALEADAATLGAHDSADAAQGGAFARPIRAHQRDHLAFVHGEVESLERVNLTVIGMQIFEFQQQRH